MLIVDLIITLFHLKLDKFIAFGLWISWKWFVMIYFITKQFLSLTNFVQVKMIYYWFNRPKLF